MLRNIKSLLSSVILLYTLQLIKAELSNETFCQHDIDSVMYNFLKSENEIIKLRLEVVQLIAEKQNQYIVDIHKKLNAIEQCLDDKFGTLLEMLKTSKLAQLESEKATELTTNDDQLAIDISSSKENLASGAKSTEKLFLTDIRENEEPKLCKLNGDNKLECYIFQLPMMCADSNSINCVDNQCRIRNSIYGSKSFWVSCDGDWTVIQRRINGSENFNRNWIDYKEGFGDLNGEFWIGLDKLHALTSGSPSVQLYVKMIDFDDVLKYARYDLFAIGNESDLYALRSIGGYSGNAGDSLSYHNSDKFSTKDKDNDKNDSLNCADKFHAGWWYYECDVTYNVCNLNGNYYETDAVPADKLGSGIWWKTFCDEAHSMKFVQMMIKTKTN